MAVTLVVMSDSEKIISCIRKIEAYNDLVNNYIDEEDILCEE